MERRFWIGIVLLAVFLALGIWVTCFMIAANTPVAQTLEQASQAALDGDLEAGISLSHQAKAQWEQHRSWAAAVADHEPMEEIDSLFAQLEVYGQTGDSREFAAYCAKLSQLVDALGDAHGFTWWNLL